jgi:hypothetical protein
LQKDWTYTPTSLLILHRHVMGWNLHFTCVY